jgi:type IV secretory pathway component VirB8
LLTPEFEKNRSTAYLFFFVAFFFAVFLAFFLAAMVPHLLSRMMV